jgi:two-component system LytT family response regulator
MNCIIVDDEPLARKGIQSLVEQFPQLELIGSFNSAMAASDFMQNTSVDLVFLDIQMPNITGLEFAKTIKKDTLIIFTTAYSEYALDSYEVDAIDYLVKPIEFERFQKAVNKAISYHQLLQEDEKENIDTIASEYIFVKSERRFFKVNFKDILFIEGLKDYVIIQLNDQRIITKMNLKTIHELLPKEIFFRINKSYIANTTHIESFDNNDIFIKNYEIAIGNSYREAFFSEYVMKNKIQ